jgi:RNA polymerase sigma-B factor
MTTQLRQTRSGAGVATISEDRGALHEEYFRTRDPELRERLLATYSGLARAMAKRFGQRGHPLDDLLQVAYVGLLKAIDGFDPTRGLRFSTYAMPTILGELKRHLRDQSWGIRPPRRVHDLYLAVERTVDDLAQDLRRKPTVKEVADALGVADESVLEAMEAATGRKLPSLDVPPAEGPALVDSIAREDPQLGHVERSLALATLLCHLPERDEEVLRMRFERDMTQLEIARALGRSQMQVSRTLARGLDRLRAMAEVEAVLTE